MAFLAIAVRPAIEWGREASVRELFGERVSSLRFVPREFHFRYRSPEHLLEYFRTWYGPTKVAFAGLDEAGQGRLDDALRAVYRRFDRSGGKALDAPSAYVEVIAVKR